MSSVETSFGPSGSLESRLGIRTHFLDTLWFKKSLKVFHIVYVLRNSQETRDDYCLHLTRIDFLEEVS